MFDPIHPAAIGDPKPRPPKNPGGLGGLLPPQTPTIPGIWGGGKKMDPKALLIQMILMRHLGG